jgi:hypothetical protein
MLCLPKIRMTFVLAAVLAALLPALLAAQDDPNDAPLGDVARSLRKNSPPSANVVDDDNLSQVMEQGESNHRVGSALRFLMAGEGKGFRVSVPDATCSLSFTANVKSLLSSQYAQMDLPPADVLKLEGPATIEGDALTVSVFNGTDWHVSEVAVALTVVKKNEPKDAFLPYGRATFAPAVAASLPQESEVRPEKRPDVTVIYRMRAAAAPFATTIFSAPLNLDLAPGEEWHWAIVQAKGYPPQTYTTSAPSPTAQTSTPAPVPSRLPPALLEPQNSPATSLPQGLQ